MARALTLSVEAACRFQCGVGIHPAFIPEKIHGGYSAELELASKMDRPCLLLPASNDNAVKVNSPIVKCMARARGDVPENEISVEFPTMKHGWVSRGDARDSEIAQQQERALQMTTDFIKEHSTT